MVLICCVRDYGYVGTKNFHSFPTNNETAVKWISAIQANHLMNRLNPNSLSNSYTKVCRKHFKESDLTTNGKGQVVVKPNCVPTLFLPKTTDVLPVLPATIESDIECTTESTQHSLTAINSMAQLQYKNGSDANVVESMPDAKIGVRAKKGRKTAIGLKITVRGCVGCPIFVIICCVVLFC